MSANFAYDVVPPEYALEEAPDEDDLIDEAPCALCNVLTLRVFLQPVGELLCAPGARACPGCCDELRTERAGPRPADIEF
ncbi:MAG TPA: hypothetical protein VFZ61_03850 [Polyangiales bacterium]